MITSGFHPSRFANTYAWIANVGVAKMQSTFAPEALQLRDLRADVRRGDLVRLGGDDLRPERPRPSFRLARRSFP